jgi:VIT1/CCC1 family predicted Fe2+/Mn2+ transporter
VSDESQISNARLNWLRAAVLGANDGIVSVSAIVLGVAGATANRHTIFTAGLAGLVAGALSMGLGEYVSVSSQRDSEEAYIAKEKQALADNPAEELQELAQIYQHKGLSVQTAKQVAQELTGHDVIRAHRRHHSLCQHLGGARILAVRHHLYSGGDRAVRHRLLERHGGRRLAPPGCAAGGGRRYPGHAHHLRHRPFIRRGRELVISVT